MVETCIKTYSPNNADYYYTHLEPEVSTVAVRHFECLQCLEATAVVGDIYSIKELVELLYEHSCLSGILSKEELDSFRHTITQDLKV